VEIQFEPVELDRDRAFQERWQDRRKRISPRMAQATAPPSAPLPQQQHLRHAFPRFGHADHLAAHISSHVAAHGAPSEHPFNQYDDELKEAIRRSLQDVAPEEGYSVDKHVVAGNHSNETTTENERNESVEEVKDSEASVHEVKQPATSQPILVAVETVEDSSHEDDLEEGCTIGKEPVEAYDVYDKDVDIESGSALKPDLEIPLSKVDTAVTANVPRGLVSAEAFKDELEMKPAAVDNEVNSTSKHSGAEDSFASDAIGSGDVAEAMGATLDMVAGVIIEILSEADLHSKSPEKNYVDSASQASGAVILDSAQSQLDAEDDRSDTENEWQVVTGTETSSESLNETCSHDQDIARAAEMLGSALFNSDLKSSGEIRSQLSCGGSVSEMSSPGSSFSSAFSVPTTAPSLSSGMVSSHVTAAQRGRWSMQLYQLREIGFDNEELCVETLERLSAANIGVDSSDEVSVTQVVNELLKH
jgi:hypothetical protein